MASIVTFGAADRLSGDARQTYRPAFMIRYGSWHASGNLGNSRGRCWFACSRATRGEKRRQSAVFIQAHCLQIQPKPGRIRKTTPLKTFHLRPWWNASPFDDLGQNNFRLAAEAGLHLLRILDAEGLGTYRPLYRKAYSLKTPAEDIRQGLDDDTLRFLEVVAGRTRRWFAALCKAGRTSKKCGAGNTVHRVTF